MKQYNCFDSLIKKLSIAVNDVVPRALEYDGEGPYRIQTDELTKDYGLDNQYLPLLIEMLKEDIPGVDAEIIDDEIFLYTDQQQEHALHLSAERMNTLLGNALEWIGEMSNSSDLYNTLKNAIGMTDDEILAADFDVQDESLVESIAAPGEEFASQNFSHSL